MIMFQVSAQFSKNHRDSPEHRIITWLRNDNVDGYDNDMVLSLGVPIMIPSGKLT
jgi:hypothetical protein